MADKSILKKYLHTFLIVFFCLAVQGFSKQPDFTKIKNSVQAFKKDSRGPFKGIRWFCPDGTIIPAKKRCSEPGGIQHALHKDVVVEIREDHGIYLGQILAGTPKQDFLDVANHNSRMKQYQMEKFLQTADDGWIMRLGRFYRGALQAEDEEAWGKNFLSWLLSNDELLQSQFYLTRQICKDIPHNANDDRSALIRAISKNIADSLSLFMNTRIKIHGEPDETDLDRVREFRTKYKGKIPPNIDKKLKTLEQELALVYRESSLQSLQHYRANFPVNTPVGYQLNKCLQNIQTAKPLDAVNPEQSGRNRDDLNNRDEISSRCKNIAHLLWSIRKNITTEARSDMRLTMMNLSIELESILFRNIGKWQPRSIGELLEKIYIFAKSAVGCGFVEIWEWEVVESVLLSTCRENLSLDEFLEKAEYSRRTVEWSAGMVRAVYSPVVNLFLGFEPLASGFVDDRIRSSILLPFGELVSQLSELANNYSGLSSRVLDLTNQNHIRGLNLGFAMGELEVVTGPPDNIEFSPKKIYVLLRAPADLKPVAGIATVSEGNAVSHVQLLARNLGIPNAAVTLQNFDELVKYSGSKIFYAVSSRGSVLMKFASEMSQEEISLVSGRKRRNEKIAVPIDEINLTRIQIMSLKDLRATDSGRICGPKAANLGELNALFPDKVAPGLVIPFGVFREHLDQQIPGTSNSYWQFLQETFAQTAVDREDGVDDKNREQKILFRLLELREAIQSINFKPEFIASLKQRFLQEFNVEFGQLPIFVRSDTNMEDLKEFTGAGLNLTVANTMGEQEIFQAIRDVWASPFTERSFRWRQIYLLNPENVYPSLLLLPSVNVDKSGVMITTGLASSASKDITVAMNWGGGGAVEGQAAETYLLSHDGKDILLSPAREPQYSFLPAKGGVVKKFVNFDKPILNRSERYKLRLFAEEIRRTLPGTPGIETRGPFDIELGFWNDLIWLFQVRPFVENKIALSSSYLSSMDSEIPRSMNISLTDNIELHGH